MKMLLTTYEQLSDADKMLTKYGNPCITSDPAFIRVGETLDDELGHFVAATKSDF